MASISWYREITSFRCSSDKAINSPYTPLPDELIALSDEHRKEVISLYQEMLAKQQLMTPQANGTYPLFDYLKLMGYDDQSLTNRIFFYRNGESDFINVEFTSDNPDLSAFVVNTFVTEFIDYHRKTSDTKQDNTLALLDSVLREKEIAMNIKNSMLGNYKSSSGAVNIGSQADVLFQQISEQENKRSTVASEIQSLRGALKSIDEKLGKSQEGAESITTTENNEIIQLGRQLELANQRYVDNGFREADKRMVDSLQQLRSLKMSQLSNNQRVTSDPTIKSELLKERQSMEIALSKAESSVSSIETELASLRSKYYSMVPADAVMQNYEREADLAVKEYTDALNRYNQAKLENTASTTLRVSELGYPGLPEPSKTLIFLALSGIASAGLLLTVLVILFLVDRSITDPKQLSEATAMPILGSLNYVRDHDKDLRVIWNGGEDNQEYGLYRNLLRSLRFEITNKVLNTGGKVLGITSLSTADGKTFLASGLAYAFAMTGKKVLLIGEDYPNLTELISNKQGSDNQEFESFLVKKEIMTEDLITVLNRNPENTSLLEIKDADSLNIAFDILKREFDIIIIDINNLKDTNQVKEWLMFTDKCVAVFASGGKLVERDKEFLQYLKEQPGYLGWIFNKVELGKSATVV